MRLSIKNSIYQAIINNKWLEISYVNKKEESIAISSTLIRALKLLKIKEILSYT